VTGKSLPSANGFPSSTLPHNRSSVLFYSLLLSPPSHQISFSISFTHTFLLDAGDIPAATKEDVEVAVAAAKAALSRNKGADWASASGAVRARYLRAIAAKVFTSIAFVFSLLFIHFLISIISCRSPRKNPSSQN